MIFDDEIRFDELQEWMQFNLKRNHIYRYSQVINKSSDELMREGLSLGTMLHLSEHLETKGMQFTDGKRCIARLHLCKPLVERLFDNGIWDLDDLEAATRLELTHIGFTEHMATYIYYAMKRMGRPIAWK